MCKEQIACMFALIMNTPVDSRNYCSPFAGLANRNEGGKEKLLIMRTEQGIISRRTRAFVV